MTAHPLQRLRLSSAAILIALLLTTGCSHRHGGGIAPQEASFLWRQANAQMAAADSADAFDAAARTYRKLEAGGISNGPLLYNLGVALLMSGANEEALSAFLRAERYLGAAPDLRNNLELAWQRQPDTERTWPWTRTVFALHYRIPLAVRQSVLWLAYQLLWIGMLGYALRKPALGRPVFIVAALLLAVMATSVGTTLQQESTDRRQAMEIASSLQPGEARP